MNYFLRLKNDAAGLWHFIQKPNDDQIHISPKNRFLLIFNLLLIEVILHFIIVFPCNYLVENVITVQEAYPLSNLTLLNLFLLAVITAPLLEEILFRYSLRYHQLFSRFISREKWNRIFPYLVYFSAVAFGFVHLGNYVNDSWKFYALSPLIIISQLSGGFILSYIRVTAEYSVQPAVSCPMEHAVCDCCSVCDPLFYTAFYRSYFILQHQDRTGSFSASR